MSKLDEHRAAVWEAEWLRKDVDLLCGDLVTEASVALLKGEVRPAGLRLLQRALREPDVREALLRLVDQDVSRARDEAAAECRSFLDEYAREVMES